MEGAKIDAELVCLEEVVEGDIDAKKSKKWLQPSTWTWQGEYNGLSPKAGTAASTKVSFLLPPTSPFSFLDIPHFSKRWSLLLTGYSQRCCPHRTPHLIFQWRAMLALLQCTAPSSTAPKRKGREMRKMWEGSGC